jgi:phosphate transport system substrate-binding protein
MKLNGLICGAVFLSLVSSGISAAELINGAGATFPYPLYSKWFSEYQKANPDVQINYQSIGSGGGIRQFQEGTVDFGASDAPMTDEQLAKSPGVLHVPTVLGAVVLTYSLPGVSALRLDGPVVADIFLGKVTKWNDERIAAQNPGVKLPDDAILVVHRSDGSGTSAIFTDYLTKVSPDWASKVGKGAAVNWPVGLGGKGNEGVTGLIKQTPGSIGYVELIFAESNQLPFASLKNRSGAYVSPSVKSVTDAAAAAAKSIPDDFRVSITDSQGKGAYPISGFTYLLVKGEMPKEKGARLVAFLEWALADGQKLAAPLFYAPLPTAIAKKAEAKVRGIRLQ